MFELEKELKKLGIKKIDFMDKEYKAELDHQSYTASNSYLLYTMFDIWNSDMIEEMWENKTYHFEPKGLTEEEREEWYSSDESQSVLIKDIVKNVEDWGEKLVEFIRDKYDNDLLDIDMKCRVSYDIDYRL